MSDIKVPTKELDTMTLTSKRPVCAICMNEPFMPVTWNHFTKSGSKSSDNRIYDDKGNVIITIKCQASIRSMVCLTCARSHISSSMRKNGTTINCPLGCCKNSIVPKHSMYLYGDVSRCVSAGAEEEKWWALYQYGCLNMKCNRCQEECSDPNELFMHPKTRCPKRMSPCMSCNESVSFDEIDKHRAKCGAKCCFQFMH